MSTIIQQLHNQAYELATMTRYTRIEVENVQADLKARDLTGDQVLAATEDVLEWMTVTGE